MLFAQNPLFMYLKLLTFCALLAMSIPMMAQNQILTPELLWKIGRVALDAVSPDGQWAVYGVTKFDMAANSSSRALYLGRISNGETRLLTDTE